MINVLGLALYGPLAASNRYRLGQYVPGLARQGINLEIRHLLGNHYLRHRFKGGSPPLAYMLNAVKDRLADLSHQNTYDLAILHCELFPLLPGWSERLLLHRPYIYDFDDAFYLKYRNGWGGLARHFLGRKFESVISGAAAVTAGNHTLAQYAREYNDKTHYFPTVVDTTRYLPNQRSRNGTFTVGWIGSPSTAPYLAELIEPLSVIGQEGSVQLIVIGGRAPIIPNVKIVEVEWREETEIDLINSFDVGVMPLPDDEWARGKCAFKLIQYMACAIPVIASSVGANIDVVNSECGYLVKSNEEWVAALRALRDDSDRRTELGQAGHIRVEQNYSLHHNLPLLASLICEVANKN